MPRTTLTLEQDVYALAKRYAEARGIRLGKAVTELLRRGLEARTATRQENGLVSRDAVSPGDAVELLKVNLEHRHHRFWPADLALPEALARFGGRLLGYRQTTDAYLLGLALHHRGRLATFDRGVTALRAEGDPAREAIELIGPETRGR